MRSGAGTTLEAKMPMLEGSDPLGRLLYQGVVWLAVEGTHQKWLQETVNKLREGGYEVNIK